MYVSYSYPWYLQKSVNFTTLYDGIAEVAQNISPLGIGDFFNYLTLPAGQPLYQLGKIWGLLGSPGFYDGLIYDIDKWSETKVWSGHLRNLDDILYRNFMKMKMYIQSKPYSLTLIRDALNMLLDGTEHTITVDEDLMSFVINISATTEVLRIVQEINSFDSTFLGKPTGVSYTFNYVATDEPEGE